MILHSLGQREKEGYTTWGCMWEMGQCQKDTKYQVKGEHGQEVPMQSRITAYWPDGSVKWTAHTSDARWLGDTIEVMPGKTAEPENKMEVLRQGKSLTIQAGTMKVVISGEDSRLFDEISYGGKPYLLNGHAILMLEEPSVLNGDAIRIEKQYATKVTEIEVEEEGSLQTVIRYTGHHVSQKGEAKIPFIIRMKIGYNSRKIDFVHTFMYDGNEEKDFLKGLGIRFQTPLDGRIYNRHIKFTTDHGVFHESMAHLLSWIPRVPQHIYESQMKGETLNLQKEEQEIVDRVTSAMPFWSEYDLCQDSVSHFCIRKKMKDNNCCYLDCLSGQKTEGGAAFGSEQGSVLLAIRDFWEKYPSGYTIKGMDGDLAEATMWFWSPKAEAMDFRHYANRGYHQVYYEGYDYKGATPYGIACTNECSVMISDRMIPADEEMESFAKQVKAPVQYVGTPEFYHSMRAFGYWSLPERGTKMEQWLEKQLDQAVDFYTQEVRQRNWYGMFNYGDFMHTYDRERHQWRYDMGGYAWDNTELVPTLWLWYQFMRTGREEVFILAEKLSRHASEVDVYHMGKYKGLGSRHNVRHWGCPCKEARIAMAAHHRFYYYLTGDHRMEDIFEELKDNEMTFLNKDPLGDFYNKEEMVFPSHARSGPDWSSLCANWMTRWERVQDETYKEKIVTGISDIKRAPLKLVSGPDFEFDPKTVHLRYIGERAAGGTHLQICMGAPQVWMELADLLEDEEWKQMLADYGRFYYLPRQQQLEESGGLIGERSFSLPFMAAAMGAYGARHRKDPVLAKRTWQYMLHAMIHERNHEGFDYVVLQDQGNQKELKEIPWISTNFVAQWCLNIIVVLEFIREYLPKTLEEADRLVEAMPEETFRKA